jgi:uncharacterized membrane protein
MGGIEILIFACFFVTFGPPIIFFVIGLVKRKTQMNVAKSFFILSAVWLIIGGGICASILT